MMSAMDTDSLVNLEDTLREQLKGGQGEAALMLLTNLSKAQIQSHAWDIVPVVCEFLTPETQSQDQECVATVGKILNHLADNANVKELLLVLLEQVDNFDDDVKFKILLEPIQRCLLNFPGKKSSSIAIAMETLYSHLEALSLPADQELEGKERMLLDLDEDTLRITDVVFSFVEFLKPLVDEFKWTKVVGIKDSTRNQRTRTAMDLTKYLIRVLNKPMSYLDLCLPAASGDKERIKSASRECVESIISLLSLLQSDFHKTINVILSDNHQVTKKKKQTARLREQSEESDEVEHYDVEDVTPMLGLSVFCFLAFGDRLEPDNIPQVLSHPFIFDFSSPYVTYLLQQQENLIRFQGVCFLHSLLLRIPEGTFLVENLESSHMKSLLVTLVQVLTTSKVKELGQTAARCLKLLVKRFNVAGRNQFLYQLISSTSHVGLKGYAITLIKDEIAENLSRQNPEMSLVGKKLFRLLGLVYLLPASEQTDLLEHSDQIMSALNLLRFLILRDKPVQNVTGIWDTVPGIQASYCEPLRKAINLSRAHYQLELRKTKEEALTVATPMAFSVENCVMPEMSPEQQITVIETAIHSFDMMESILGRVTELIDQQNKIISVRN